MLEGAGADQAGRGLRGTSGQQGKWGNLAANAALRQAAYGNAAEARQSAAEA